MTVTVEVHIDYTNHAGVRSIRHIAPSGTLWFGSTEWHPQAQWLLEAYDIDKDAFRTFAVADINRWSSKPLEPAEYRQINNCKLTEIIVPQREEGDDNEKSMVKLKRERRVRDAIALLESEGVIEWGASSRVDVSIAKQLQNSMELNARMKNRLQQIRAVSVDDGAWEDLLPYFDAILKDEELPKWPGEQ